VGDSGGRRGGRRALARRRCLTTAEGLQLLEHGIEGLALDELHGIEEHSPVLADLEDRDDIGVVQPGRGPCLAAEPLLAAGVLADGGGEDFQRDVPAQGELLGLVDDPHAAPADLAEDAVARDPVRTRTLPALSEGSARHAAGGLVRGPAVGARLLDEDHHREDFADAVGQLRILVGVFRQRGPLAPAVTRDEALGELADRIGRRAVFGHGSISPRPPGMLTRIFLSRSRART
jgi:hypothetical protein